MVELVIEALGGVRNSRFFETERGYQGDLIANLKRVLDAHQSEYEILDMNEVIVEQEYQKTLERHGLRYRPDIIVHRPATGDGDVREGNVCILECKLEATVHQARQDFRKMDQFFEVLHYRQEIFININSENAFGEEYNGEFRERIHFFAASENQGIVCLHHQWFEEGHIRRADHEVRND